MVSGYAYYYGAIDIKDAYKLLKRDVPELSSRLDLAEFRRFVRQEAMDEDSIYPFDMAQDIVFYLEVEDYRWVLAEQAKKPFLDYRPVNIKEARKVVSEEEKLWGKPEKALHKWIIQQGEKREYAVYSVFEYISMMRNDIPLTEIVNLISLDYDLQGLEEVQIAADLIMAVWNNIPRWELKGWTAAVCEQYEKPALFPLSEKPLTVAERDSSALPTDATKKVGRNDPCPCGSGKKYKNCCLRKDEALEQPDIQAIWQNIKSRTGSPGKKLDYNVSPADYKALIEAFEQFNAAEPWNWMSEVDLFALEFSEGEVYYVSVMGNAGEVFGLAIYPGEEGLTSYNKMRSPEIMMNIDSTSVGPCILISWGQHRELLPEEERRYKELGYSFRGSKWPVFRRYDPGYHPWKLTAHDIILSARILEHSLSVVQHCQQHRRQWNNRIAKDQIAWCKVTAQESFDLEKALEWKELPEVIIYDPLLIFDQLEVQRLKSDLPRKDIAWEVDWFFSREAVQDSKHEVPWYPVVTVLGDAGSGLITNFDISRYEELNVTAFLMKNMREKEYIPRQILVNSLNRAFPLDDFCDVMDIDLAVVNNLQLDDLKNEML